MSVHYTGDCLSTTRSAFHDSLVFFLHCWSRSRPSIFCTMLTLGDHSTSLCVTTTTPFSKFANGLAGQPTLHGKSSHCCWLRRATNTSSVRLACSRYGCRTTLTHHINFHVLVLLGDAFVFLLGTLLWANFLPNCPDLRRRLFYFVPVSCLLFQLRYQEAADWSTAALQHMPCLFFSFAAIYLVRASSRAKFCMSLACLVLAICSSGNGFLLVPVGLLSLAISRNYLRCLGWTLSFAGAGAIYFCTYTRVNLEGKQPLISTLFQLRSTYFLLFLGSIASRPWLSAGIVLGVAVCAFLAYLGATGDFRRATATTYCMFYLLLTAVAVAVFRGNVDPTQISTSRYTIYSALVLIFSWILLLERREADASTRRLPAPLLSTVIIAALLFAASTYVAGLHAIRRTNKTLVDGMVWYEHPKTDDLRLGPIIPLSTDDDEQKSFEVRARQELTRSIELGIYIPPAL